MQEGQCKIAILIPRLINPGGIASYYSSLRPYFGDNVIYIHRGKQIGKNDFLRIGSDYFFLKRLLNKNKNISAVVINSSLGKGGFIRDGIYCLLTSSKQKKIVFFHGWNPNFEKQISKSGVLRFWLRRTFLKANHIIVLSSNFQNKLRDWGYEGSISLETTLVDELMLEKLNFRKLRCFREKSNNNYLLYLGNIAKTKGVWEITNAFEVLFQKHRHKNVYLSIAGGGNELESLQEYATINNLPIKFLGYVRNEKKIAAFQNAHLYVFASYHEGMPLSVLEAMAFGLPVITTRVGGIPDFFEDGKMGLFLDNRDPKHIAEKIQYLLDRPDLMKQMSEYNYNYAKEHFYASKVAKRLEYIIQGVLKE